MVKAVLQHFEPDELDEITIHSWIRDHRIPSGKTLDLPIYEALQSYLNGDGTKWCKEFDQYLFNNQAPKAVTTRMKLNEKFLDDKIKPRYYDVFHPVHAILSGPVYHALAAMAKRSVVGY